MPFNQRTRSSPVTRIQPVLDRCDRPVLSRSAASCEQGVTVDETEISDWVDELMTKRCQKLAYT
jgi:hypothetical protein